MECLEFRRRVQAEPGSRGPSLVEHETRCPACARFRQRLGQFDELIRQALLVEIPAGLAKRNVSGSSVRRSWLGIAAGLVLAVSAGVLVRLSVPASEAEVFIDQAVRHLEHEPEAFDAVSRPVDAARVDAVLAAHGVRVAEAAPVLYAQTCVVGGRRVAHLVVRSGSGAVTVILLPDQHLSETEIHETGAWSVRIVPTAGGSLAIVGHDQPVEPAAERRIVGAVAWEA